MNGRGSFTSYGPFSITDGGTIPLTGQSCECTAGGIVIPQDGVYYAVVSVNVPVNTDMDTCIRLELNDRRLTPPDIDIHAYGSCAAHSYSGNAVFRAEAGSLLRLVSTEPISCPDVTAQPVFTLTLIRL